MMKDKSILGNNEETEEINPETIVYQFIDELEMNLILEKMQNQDYHIPNTIINVEDVKTDLYIPENVNLNIATETGTVLSGTIVYEGITYTYDGNKLSY